ncbi:MAG TPA: ATP-binding cassette domain-containing protein [Candidatus Coprenecus stercoravium]|uniref:ATP-binding cassette domain-containing protein n=1 Tax=Candidatus Coprenecus stercoravium TaxID=2840735 RepID=A0A9D2KBN5_9BACT|nr:ATP-binding cassette domain-containing protein [Candidatus Coprenecus stercoravium]
MDTNRPVVKIDHLKFNYRKHIVFEDLSLELEPGRIYGLLGENGVGKTTLLRIICGLLRTKEGVCTVNGTASQKRNPEMLSDIYYVPEIFFAPAISVNTFARSNSLLYPRWDAGQFRKICQTFDIDPSHRFDKLSHGQQKKALIAFAVALNTRILLMDEPSNGLDIPSKTTLRRIISECAAEDRIIVISTHQVRDLENLIDPIIILDRSGMIMNATIERISGKLSFITSREPDPEAYWSESSLNGYFQVIPNRENIQSGVNLEALFNAALKNKESFKNLFK